MKVIFSRKGFDSTKDKSGAWPNGGVASPIIDSHPCSLPIPANEWPTEVRYRDLGGRFPFTELVRDLTRGRLSGDEECHLDPDISKEALARLPGWQGAFGQTGIQENELVGQGVRAGDLFIFYGFFRNAEKPLGQPWRLFGPEQHRIWGWLQVGRRLDLTRDLDKALKEYPEQSRHPHMRPGWEKKGSNSLYVASECLTSIRELGGYAGWGVFNRGYQLTKPGEPKSVWSVPVWLNRATGGVGMTHHPKLEVWNSNGTVRTKSPGQEYIADTTTREDEAQEWLRTLFHVADAG